MKGGPVNSVPNRIELSVQDLTVRYGTHLVLSIPDEVLTGPGLVALVGPNGAGKTTLLQVLSGLTVPKTGNVTLDGVDVQQGPTRAAIAFVPDRPVLFDDITLTDTKNHVVTLARCRQPDPLGAELWDRFALTDLANRFPSQLSRGQRQKATLAVALSRPAELLLLDEPTIALDDDARTQLADALETAAQTRLIICATHDEDLASTAQLTLRLQDGRLLDD